MDGASGRYGAVAGVQKSKNPVKTARAVLEHGGSSFLIGTAADEFVQTSGAEMIVTANLPTVDKHMHWAKRVSKPSILAGDLETFGAVDLDLQGHLAATGSTQGMSRKTKSGLSHTDIMGAGLYANKETAVVW